LTLCLRQTPKGLFLHLRATPKSGRDEIAGFSSDGTLQAKVTATPDKGKANEAVIATLAKTIHVAKSTFTQVSGETMCNKVFRIEANEDAVANWLMDFAKKQN
jgi:uncharacterized protein